MNKLILTLIFFFSNHAFSKCDWSKAMPIGGDKGIYFQECSRTKEIRINGIKVKPTIYYKLNFDDKPEWNSLWAKISPNKKTAVIYLENNDYERNAWVVSLDTLRVELFSDVSVGKHFIVEFTNNSEFTIAHAGMGYRTEFYYSKASGQWKNIGHEEIKVNME